MPTIISDAELEQTGFYWRGVEGVRALVCSTLEQSGFVNGFSTRSGGVSSMPENSLNLAGFNEDAAENILENRRRFLKLFDGKWVFAGCWQMHGADVRLIRNVTDAKPAEDAHGETIYCDAIVSNAEGILAGVKTADCVPILLGDPGSGAFAAVHAGWRGTLAEVVLKALDRMADEYQAQPGNIRVAIGPSAGACCYEVGTDVIGAFTNRFADAGTLFKETRTDHACIDLLAANKAQLVSAGVDPQKINIAPLCTMCRTDLFFSYRREKKIQGKVGRLMSVIGKRPRS
ncbi:MAG TPA: peptidoglycan editing factor PgeF [Pyrinomonadaceae bacterium]|nr:peptidoglycan editing factor PgeF [Pyrinomonadaceae bacterium]